MWSVEIWEEGDKGDWIENYYFDTEEDALEFAERYGKEVTGIEFMIEYVSDNYN